MIGEESDEEDEEDEALMHYFQTRKLITFQQLEPQEWHRLECAVGMGSFDLDAADPSPTRVFC